MNSLSKLFLFFFIVFFSFKATAKDYFVHPLWGDDQNSGISKESAFKTLDPISQITFLPGDQIILAFGQVYLGSLKLIGLHGTKENPITITSLAWENEDTNKPAVIDFKNLVHGILVEDCSFIEISNIKLTGNGYFTEEINHSMRCGLLITSKNSKLMEHIAIKEVSIQDVFYNNPGFIRGAEEVRTANGTQKYGWGIRIINTIAESIIENVTIKNCSINSVCHTGIKLTGNNKNIRKIELLNNTIEKTGGPGIQMSEVAGIYVSENKVTHSGCNDDSRKWGRGSGLWTWGSSNVLIEKNEFLYANGPGDSAGAHIDYNCDNIVLQYNISAYNAGGFCEILGNNYNCMYRYNISINDGHRIKGVNGAFQEGKVFWLSGYQGDKKQRKGPVNSYFYNNTIYSDETIEAKFAIDNSSNGILIANNIFCIKGKSKVVLGDQNKQDSSGENDIPNVFFKNNLFIKNTTWPKEFKMIDASPSIGNPKFKNEGGLKIEDYIPKNKLLKRTKGIQIEALPENSIPLLFVLKVEKDILNNPINGLPPIGAINRQ